MNNWLVNGLPTSFWMPGFFFPQGFLTGCLQTHARNYKIAIDKLSFSFQIMPEEDPSEVEESPEDGVYIYGLFMDGARWERDNQVVADQFPSEMYN
jgi:dynein heavy chain, axonemal